MAALYGVVNLIHERNFGDLGVWRDRGSRGAEKNVGVGGEGSGSEEEG
jgi:hypothetical protein